MTKTHLGFVINTTKGPEYYCVEDAHIAQDQAVIDHLDPEHAHDIYEGEGLAIEFCCICGHTLGNKRDAADLPNKADK
jgi:hypothetical protein